MSRAIVRRRHASGLPPELTRSTFGVVRPRDGRGVYAFPAQEFKRLAAGGLLHRLAHGYYAVVPPDARGREWLPSLEASAYGIAAATYGADQAILMGLSAARMHGAVPRGLGIAAVAVPSQRPPVTLTDRRATIQFRRRRTEELDAERMPTDLGSALVTSREQTILDLAKRVDAPVPGDIETSAIVALFDQVDTNLLQALARQQRLAAALDRAHAIRAAHA